MRKWKMNKKLRQLLTVVVIGVIVLILYVFYATRPLDEITNYEVEVTPADKGAVTITYRFDWKVLNDSREGPLTWVKLGMANYDYGIVEYGGAIVDRHSEYDFSSQSGPYASFDLDRAYYKGETASFWFTVVQSSLMCENPDNENQPFFDFTPGWFNWIRVKHYRFIWNNPASPISHNADREMGDTLIWEGELNRGQKRNMRITYDINDFDSPYLVTWIKPHGNNGGDGGVDSSVVVIILVAIVYMGYHTLVGDDGGYGKGRGYGGGSRYYHGGSRSGGGGGCACAGCACACACAGGGRAGCSQKDFYGAIHVPKEIPRI